ncbi:MAG: hypothetical protein Q7K44_01670 [Candidatus Liptonbacteria bacterium]|nr:hypothetical protein [Candidatus Liptonbacteria bacterium]
MKWAKDLTFFVFARNGVMKQSQPRLCEPKAKQSLSSLSRRSPPSGGTKEDGKIAKKVGELG